MDDTRRTTQQVIVAAPPPSAKEGATRAADGAPSHDRQAIWRAAVPVAFVVLLLMLATTSQGAFAISRWAPLALLTLAALIGVVLAGGGLAVRSGGIRLALVGIWGLAGWSMLSMLWAKSSGDAFISADQVVLYAAIVTLPLALPASRQSLAAAGWAIAAGIGLVACYTLLRLLSDGEQLFLAGRLNGPINYRNATALLFALPFWPFIIAAAAPLYRRAIRATALAAATLCLSLAFLTQSRGILIGLAAGAVVALALGPDRVRRAWLAIVVVAAVGASSHWLLRPFHAWDAGHGYVTGGEITTSAKAAALLTIGAFVVGLVVALFDMGLRTHTPQMRHARRAARLVLLAGVLAAILAAIVAVGNPISFAHRKWDEFTSLSSTTPTSTRYVSVGGQRYDLWRVALKEFSGSPLLGVGAGNYSFDYYRLRRTNRNLDDPHSLVFTLLSEDGLVGTLLFALFLGGLVAAAARGWPSLVEPARRHAVGPIATGVVLLGQSSIDWMWRIPGITAIGLLALALGVAQTVVPSSSESAGQVGRAPVPTEAASARVAGDGRSRARVSGRVLVGLGLVLATLAVLSVFMYNAYVQRARGLIGNPTAELSAARTAASFDPWSVTPHYLESSAYETMGDRRAAFAQLQQALSLEPSNLATLGVIGDFEARGRQFDVARGYYRRALALDPLDTGLQQLARIGLNARAAKRNAT